MKNIQHRQLLSFLDSELVTRNDFAKYCYISGATRFVEHESSFDIEKMKSIHSYRFDEFYTDEPYSHQLEYYVLCLPNQSYLMYEFDHEITIWVCFTEEHQRGKGTINILLTELRRMYPDTNIVIDTFSASLREYCRKLSINIFDR